MSESQSKDRPGGSPAEPRPLEEVMRELGAPATPAARGGSEDEALREVGAITFDKSGALAGRPKLKPRKAHRAEEAEADGDEAATEKAAAPQADQVGGAGRAKKAALPPKRGALRPAGMPQRAIARAAAGEDDEVLIPAGTFLYGEARQPRELPAFHIDRMPVTNAQYMHFVRATGHRPPLYWADGHYPDALRDHPVVGVDYYDALAYARWTGKDLPFEDEWERAARGVDGRTYPWGNDQELTGANTQRVGLKMTVPVDLHRTNVSPEGVRDLVGNAWEFTHSPAPGGGLVVRGGSWHDFALYAKTYFRFASKPDARNGTIGFRCVRREAPREDEPREVADDLAAAEIAARRGPQAPVDREGWSAEKRDLVVDLPRLQSHVAEMRAEALLGATTSSVAVGNPEAARPPEPKREVSAPEVPAPEPAAAEPEPEPELPAAPAWTLGSVTPEASPAETAPAETAPAEARPAADKPAVKEGEASARGEPRQVPVPIRVLVAAGLLLLVGLVVLLVNGRGDEQGEGEGSEVTQQPGPEAFAPDPLAGLPEAPPLAEFPGANEPPRILDGAYPSDRARLDEGAWLLLIIDPQTEEGEQTLATAHALHRRLASHGVHVTVVLPRDPYQDADGHLVGDEALDAQLRADGRNWLWDGIHVVLDPAEASGRGLLATKYAFEGDRVAAMLLEGGRIEKRTAPPEGGFTEASLVSLAERALDLAR